MCRCLPRRTTILWWMSKDGLAVFSFSAFPWLYSLSALVEGLSVYSRSFLHSEEPKTDAFSLSLLRPTSGDLSGRSCISDLSCCIRHSFCSGRLLSRIFIYSFINRLCCTIFWCCGGRFAVQIFSQFGSRWCGWFLSAAYLLLHSQYESLLHTIFAKEPPQDEVSLPRRSRLSYRNLPAPSGSTPDFVRLRDRTDLGSLNR